MKLFSIKENKLSKITSTSFKLEKDIQSIVESNLDVLFNLEFVRTEFSIKNFRFDTLCFDKDKNCFVVIEYKRDRNFSVIDQGYTYMSILLNNKSDFILEYNESCGGTLKRDDIDWSQSRVVFVSTNYTEYQKQSINFKDVPFELWEIKRYENKMLGMIQHKTNSEESITKVSKGSENIVSKVSKEVKVYTEDDHINKPKVPESIKEIYSNLRQRLLNLGDDIDVVPRSIYISYKRKSNFFDIHFLKSGLWCWINIKKGELDDPKNITRDVSTIGHYGVGDYELFIKDDSDLDYCMFLIKQSYNKQS